MGLLALARSPYYSPLPSPMAMAGFSAVNLRQHLPLLLPRSATATLCLARLVVARMLQMWMGPDEPANDV
jgi:hypothetical protein